MSILAALQDTQSCMIVLLSAPENSDWAVIEGEGECLTGLPPFLGNLNEHFPLSYLLGLNFLTVLNPTAGVFESGCIPP
jgi:hypothetical protein